MTDIGSQYATGLSRQHIEQALIAAGKDPGRLQPADLGMLEDFHTMGRIATSQLAGLADHARRPRARRRQRDRRHRPLPGQPVRLPGHRHRPDRRVL